MAINSKYKGNKVKYPSGDIVKVLIVTTTDEGNLHAPEVGMRGPIEYPPALPDFDFVVMGKIQYSFWKHQVAYFLDLE